MIKKIHYWENGAMFFDEAMIFRRLYAVGQSIVINSTTYIVENVAVIGDVQNVYCSKYGEVGE